MTNERTRTYTWEDPLLAFEEGRSMTGLAYMQALIAGKYPQPPIAKTLDYALIEVDDGRAVFEGEPAEFLYNPIGVVHGGYASTLLDSALGCAIHTTIPQGLGYTTVQLNINLVRPITMNSGKVRAEAKVLHRGRTMSTAEATLTDANGKMLAHATTTCLIFEMGRG